MKHIFFSKASLCRDLVHWLQDSPCYYGAIDTDLELKNFSIFINGGSCHPQRIKEETRLGNKEIENLYFLQPKKLDLVLCPAGIWNCCSQI